MPSKPHFRAAILQGCQTFQECNNELIIAKLNPIVVSSIRLAGLTLKINFIFIFEMTSEQYSNNKFTIASSKRLAGSIFKISIH